MREGARRAWLHGRMSLPIFVVDAFTSEPFRGNPAGVVLDHGDDAWMQQVAAEMRHSETAFVRPTARAAASTCAGSRPRSRSTCAGTRRSRARTCSSRRAGSPPTRRSRFHTRGGELRAEHAGAAGVTLDFPVAEPAPAPAEARALRRARYRADRVAAHRRRLLHVRRRRRRRPSARSRPTSAASRGCADVRGVYVDRARRRGLRHRVAVLRAPRRDRRRPRHGFDALRPRRVLGPAARPRRVARVPGVGPRRRVDRRAQGRSGLAHRARATTVLAGELLA